ncbi:MAG: flagellar hook-associated protein FlgK [candidate division Zixibacteria bacterium]|nr:flagellar hook-associated protein FlgK [candidate division Zixibacteria bacterium]
MSGLFQGLEIGKRALLTHQLAMSTIGHNMANVGTPGYTRQRVLVTSAMPIELANYNVGNGVTVKTVVHIRDLFLTGQYRRENKSLGEWTYKEKTLAQVETFFAEPFGEGVGNALNKFWDSWSSLASGDADSSTPRNQIVSDATTLVNSFHSLNQQLTSLRDSTDQDVGSRVMQINQYAHQIANLNRIVASQELGGQKANDLRDQKDLLIDELSKLIDVTTTEQTNGTTSIYISGLSIVENDDTFELATRAVPSGNNSISREIVWKNTKSSVKLTGGELKGLLDMRDNLIPGYKKRLDDMAATIVAEVNRVHRAGTDLNGNAGVDFFSNTGTTAETISINMSIANDSSLIAASLSGEIGDSSNALAIHDLRRMLLLDNGSATISEYFNSTVGMVGVDSNEAKTFKANYEVLMQQIELSRQSVQGVSLDEEMANLVKMQHAYNAAARVITVMDEALGTLIQGMGVVGR